MRHFLYLLALFLILIELTAMSQAQRAAMLPAKTIKQNADKTEKRPIKSLTDTSKKHSLEKPLMGPTISLPTNNYSNESIALPSNDYDRQLFLQFEYPEVKDTCKTILTAVLTILIFTLAFAKRIINFNKAHPFIRFIIIGSWLLFLISLIFSIMALGSYLSAGEIATYNIYNFREEASQGVKLLYLSALTMIGGIILLILNGVIMVFRLSNNQELKQ